MNPFVREALTLQSMRNTHDYDFETGLISFKKTGQVIPPVFKPNFGKYYIGRCEVGQLAVYMLTGGIATNVRFVDGNKSNTKFSNLRYDRWYKDESNER